MNELLKNIEIIYNRNDIIHKLIINTSCKMIKNTKSLFINDKKQNIEVDDQQYDLDALNKTNIDILYGIDTNNTKCLIYFSGFTEEFYPIYKLASFEGSIIICRDRDNNWYKNKQLYFKDIIDKIIGTHKLNNITLIGQSMGGYMSLCMSIYYNNSICIAISPQTFNNKKSNIMYHSKIQENHPPEHIIDLKKYLLENNSNSKKFIFISESECDNHYTNQKEKGYTSYWDDHLFAEYLINIPNVYILVFPKHKHALFGYIDFSGSLGKIISNDFNKLYDDPSTNSKYLLETVVFKI